MKKTVILSESIFKKVKKIIMEEITNKAPVFGSGRYTTDYSPTFKELSKIENLHTDRYKDYELDEAWNKWKNVGFNKNTEEYLIYISKFKRFMFGAGGFLKNLSYVVDRANGPLHLAILDSEWVHSLVKTKDWRYSDANSTFGGDEFQCFYTTILKLFQNPAIWNDFFFNPVFANEKKKYDIIRAKITNALKTSKEQYSPLLPMEEYRQLNFFMNEINQETKKVEKGINCKPELFYDPKFGGNDETFDDEEEF